MGWLLKEKELEMKFKSQQMISYSHLPRTVFYKLVPKIGRLKFTYSLSVVYLCRRSSAEALSPPCQPTTTHVTAVSKTARANIHFQICHRLVQPLPQKKEDSSSYNRASLPARCTQVTPLSLHCREIESVVFGALEYIQF